MNQKFKAAASGVQLLEFKDFKQSHVAWIQGELQKPNNFIWDEGRKIMVQTQDGVDIINIPAKEQRMDFIKAWLKVYNTCLATLDIDVKIICLKRKHVRKEYNKIIIGDGQNEKTIVFEGTDPKSVEYIKLLQQVIECYKQILKEENAPKNPIKVEKYEVTLDAPKEEITEVVEEKPKETKIIKFDEEKAKEIIKGEKIPDGFKFEQIDCHNIRKDNVPFVLVTCSNLDKDESLFLSNAELCLEEGLAIGAYFNGKAKNVDGAVKDSKKILKLLNELEIEGPVIYEINHKYLKSHDSAEEIAEVIDAYNGVARILTENGYHVYISTDLDTGVLLERQIKRDNIPSVYPMIYRIVPRELDQIDKNVSYVLMDPQYDNDMVSIVNPNFKIENKQMLQAA